MAALTKNAISVTVRDRAKRTKIWNHSGYKSQITNSFKNLIYNLRVFTSHKGFNRDFFINYDFETVIIF